MGIGEDPQDNRNDPFVWNVTENAIELQTARLTRQFGIPMGMHLYLDYVYVQAAQGTSLELFIDVAGEQRLNQFSDLSPAGAAAFRPRKRHFFIAATAASTRDIFRVINMPVYDKLNLFKATDSWTFGIQFGYHFEPGAMMWLDEWAELIRDKTNVPLSQTPGRAYTQVGDYRQAGRDF